MLIKIDNNGYGYFQVSFNPVDKEQICNLVGGLFDEEYYYKSKTIDYINGNVTNDLHMTLFYGVKTEDVDLDLINDSLESINLNKIHLGDIGFFTTDEAPYIVAYIKVLDHDKRLANLADTLKMFSHEISVQYDTYFPHITLAYLTREYKSNEFDHNGRLNFPLPKSILVDKIEFFKK